MLQRKLTSLLLSPSLFSISLSALFALVLIFGANWSYITPESPLYDYLFGQYGLTTLLQHSSNALAAINGIFSTPAAYNVAVIIFALFIGLFVYVFLEGIDHITAKAAGAVNEVEYISDETIKKQMKKESEVRLGLRTITLVVWCCYFLFFARVIVPYSVLLGRVDTTHLTSMASIIGLSLAFILLTFSLHLHAIFMRLLVLRPRLFGNQNIVIGRGGHDE